MDSDRGRVRFSGWQHIRLSWFRRWVLASSWGRSRSPCCSNPCFALGLGPLKYYGWGRLRTSQIFGSSQPAPIQATWATAVVVQLPTTGTCFTEKATSRSHPETLAANRRASVLPGDHRTKVAFRWSIWSPDPPDKKHRQSTAGPGASLDPPARLQTEETPRIGIHGCSLSGVCLSN